jgi:hypothetical protein
MRLVNRKSEIENGEWLPDMDLNHDKQIQSLLCYRYTIGQTDALNSLGNFPGQSSRQARTTANESIYSEAGPHSGPLPRGDGEAGRASRKFRRHNCNSHFSAVRSRTLATSGHVRIPNEQRTILPLLGERAAVRAVVTINLPASPITHHESRN